jgi:hypothetical protein
MRSNRDTDRPYLDLPKDKVYIPPLYLLQISRYYCWYEEKHVILKKFIWVGTVVSTPVETDFLIAALLHNTFSLCKLVF